MLFMLSKIPLGTVEMSIRTLLMPLLILPSIFIFIFFHEVHTFRALENVNKIMIE